MASGSGSTDPFDFDAYFNQLIEDRFNHIVNPDQQPEEKKQRRYIERDRELGHIRLWNDYFSEQPTYSPYILRRRFIMNNSLFMRIVDRLSNEVLFFQQRRDATGRFGLSGIQKCTAAIRILAYGCAGDMVDEYIRLGESTALSCLENFVEGIINLFGDEYLRKLTPDDLEQLLRVGEARGFPEMIGSIDCTLNDINVLDRSPVFNDILHGRAPKINYSVNGHDYHLAYYLTDGIYPKWATFIQSISLPQDDKASLFAKTQESVQKDVERAFGVLQARFAIVKNSALYWDKVKIGKIMRACIILHNMIVEDERNGYTLNNLAEFHEETGNAPVDYTYSADMPSNLTNMMANRSHVRNRIKHDQLKTDLVEHIWQKFGTNYYHNL